MANSKAMATLFSPTDNPTKNEDNPTPYRADSTKNEDNPTQNEDNPTTKSKRKIFDRSPRASARSSRPRKTTEGGAWRTRKQVARFLQQGKTGPNFATGGPYLRKTGPNNVNSAESSADSSSGASSGPNSADSSSGASSGPSFASPAASFASSEPYLRKTGPNNVNSAESFADSSSGASSGQKRGASDDYLRVRHFPNLIVTTDDYIIL